MTWFRNVARPPAALGLPRVSVWWIFFATGFTGGLYYPWWLWKRRAVFASLSTRERLPDRLIQLCALFGALALAAAIASIVAAASGDEGAMKDWDTAMNLAYAAFEGAMLFAHLRLRNMLHVHFNAYENNPVHFRIVWTALFGVMYFQFKLNRIASVDHASEESARFSSSV
ncbi:MAG: hypothetical protein KJ042_06390 [Deltaproteobacteria bacterium]|nr:hypothetical protein [Deltaproteobacteria bacterium]